MSNAEKHLLFSLTFYLKRKWHFLFGYLCQRPLCLHHMPAIIAYWHHPTMKEWAQSSHGEALKDISLISFSLLSIMYNKMNFHLGHKCRLFLQNKNLWDENLMLSRVFCLSFLLLLLFLLLFSILRHYTLFGTEWGGRRLNAECNISCWSKLNLHLLTLVPR